MAVKGVVTLMCLTLYTTEKSTSWRTWTCYLFSFPFRRRRTPVSVGCLPQVLVSTLTNFFLVCYGAFSAVWHRSDWQMHESFHIFILHGNYFWFWIVDAESIDNPDFLQKFVTIRKSTYIRLIICRTIIVEIIFTLRIPFQMVYLISRKNLIILNEFSGPKFCHFTIRQRII